MKNIHIIPTDKPSRVYKHLGRELKHTVRYFEQKGLLCINQHIYITSDEEIKEGDWMYYKHFGEDVVTNYNTWGGQNTNVNEHKDYYKKIILTTDPQLITDGVQAIDDEFLEWFVKNPSCEEVEVGYGWIRLTETDNEGYWVSIPDKQFEMQQEEPQQETLEDFIKSQPYYGSCTTEYLEGIEVGAKWQAERMYSEEEVLDLLHSRMTHTLGSEYKEETTLKWFEQHKKK